MIREEEIEKAAEHYAELVDKEYDISPRIKRLIKSAFLAGTDWMNNHPYWRLATEHPAADVEVIALVGKYLKVVFAHIVKDREKVVDYDGWNIPEVKWWMPIQSVGELEENEW